LRRPSLDPALVAILSLAAALMALGIGWGLPNVESWSNDALAPWLPLRVPITYFFGAHKYPYLHSWLSLVLYAPYLAFLLLRGDLDTGCFPHIHAGCFSDPYLQLSVLIGISRLLSLAMGVGTVFAVHQLVRRLHHDPRAARIAAALAAGSWGLVYYGHLSNLDVPEAFWFVLSLCAYVDLRRRGARRDYLAFGLSAGLAVGTKEAILGAYVLTGVALFNLHVRRHRREGNGGGLAGALLDPKLLLLETAALAVYVLATNPLLNPRGFVRHWSEWLPWGEHLASHRCEGEGPLDLLVLTLARLFEAMGTGPALLCLAGVPFAAIRFPGTRMLLVPMLSYLCFSLVPAGFVAMRFTLPFAVILCAYGGLLGARLLEGTGRYRTLGRFTLSVALIQGFLNVLAGDLTLLSDSRYGVEAWLRENVPSGSRVGAFGPSFYLPRLPRLGYRVEPLSTGEPLGTALGVDVPEFLVISSLDYERLCGRRGAYARELFAGAFGYRAVLDRQESVPLAEWLGRPPEAASANPRILVFRRGARPARGWGPGKRAVAVDPTLARPTLPAGCRWRTGGGTRARGALGGACSSWRWSSPWRRSGSPSITRSSSPTTTSIRSVAPPGVSRRECCPRA
jgi:hypothetical protein